jgi:hypothetical protein
MYAIMASLNYGFHLMRERNNFQLPNRRTNPNQTTNRNCRTVTMDTQIGTGEPRNVTSFMDRPPLAVMILP